MESAVEQLEQKCVVCCCAKPDEEFVTLSSCKHTFCVSCVKTSFELNISESRTDVQCLFCSEPVSPQDIASLVGPTYFTKYLEFSLRRHLSREANVKRCIAPDCPYAYIVDKPSDCTDDHFVCAREECRAEFCHNCKLAWHQGKTCEENRKLYPGLVSNVAMEIDVAKPVNFKPCPRCKAPIERIHDGSCNQIQCAACGTDFCWLCLQPISEMHFFSPTGCPLYGSKRWSRRRKWCCRVSLWLGAPFFIPLVAFLLFWILLVVLPILVGGLVFDIGKLRKSRVLRIACVTLSVIITILLSPLASLLISLLVIPFGFLYIYGVIPIHLLWTSTHRTRSGTSRKTSPSPTAEEHTAATAEQETTGGCVSEQLADLTLGEQEESVVITVEQQTPSITAEKMSSSLSTFEWYSTTL